MKGKPKNAGNTAPSAMVAGLEAQLQAPLSLAKSESSIQRSEHGGLSEKEDVLANCLQQNRNMGCITVEEFAFFKPIPQS